MDPLYVITIFGVFATLVGVIFGIMWKEIISLREKYHGLENMKAAAELGLKLLEILGPQKREGR